MLLELVAQATTQGQVQASTGNLDPYRWIPWVIAAIALLFSAIQFVLTHVLWAWVKLQNKVDDRPNEGHRRYLMLTVRNMGSEMHDVSAALVFMRDGRKLEEPMRCVGECPNPYKRNTSRNFYIENPHPRRSLELETCAVGDTWIDVRCGVIPVRQLRGKRFRNVIDEWSKPDDKLPDAPPPQPPSQSPFPEWLSGSPKRW
jgi:hypothetical protein